MSFFNITAGSSDENIGGAKEGVHFKLITNKEGKSWRVYNFDNPDLCKRNGLVELIPTKVSRRHENSLRFAKVYDKDNDIWIGIPNGFDPKTNELLFKGIVVQESEHFDLSNVNEAQKWAVIKNHYDVAGSPFCLDSKKAKYKIVDKDRDAIEFLAKRNIKRKAEDIASSLNGVQLRDVAIQLFGKGVSGMSHFQMQAEVIKFAELTPDKFMELWDHPDRHEITVLKKALANGVLVKTDLKGICYHGLPLGNSEGAAATYLKDNITLLATIEQLISKVDSDSEKAMEKKMPGKAIVDDRDAQIELLKKQLAEKDKVLKEVSATKIDELVDKTAESLETDPEKTAMLQEIKDRKLVIPGAHRIKDKAELRRRIDAKIQEANN